MAYPEPIPVLKGKDAKDFDEKLNNFSLSEDQVRKFAEAKKRFS
jgi:hypothetical protein